ncbi:transglutaminase-like domain-containing protein [Actinosynnema sp. NPDC050436]|uniref:transglutaminase-like domain-containing protein n=1 Tax=Actinosynnema sp. NPDC050436 TaxID=3155659 RepID=UPI0033EB8E03
MSHAEHYAAPGPLTGLPAHVVAPTSDPVDLCRPVRALVVQPRDAQALGLPAERFEDNQVRPADELVRRLLALDPAPLTTARPPDRRVVGTCRHFAVLGCALLRHRGVPARVRCGFATYFQPGRGVDHWVVEYRDGARWVRVDPEVLGGTVLPHAHDLRPDDFLTGGEAWHAYRRGEVDGNLFGVHGTENWGPSEIRGNAVRDLAALNKVEVLPWDEWGRMAEAYEGRTGEDYDVLLDELADVCASDDLPAVRALYEHDDLRVPDDLIR